jgi:hypothetical protein
MNFFSKKKNDTEKNNQIILTTTNFSTSASSSLNITDEQLKVDISSIQNSNEQVNDSQQQQENFEYVFSAGLDQKVFLWKNDGQCIGEYGNCDWNLKIDSTWICKKTFFDLMNKANAIKKNSSHHQYLTNKKSNVNNTRKNDVFSNLDKNNNNNIEIENKNFDNKKKFKFKILESFALKNANKPVEKTIDSNKSTILFKNNKTSELNRYIENLSKKISSKECGYNEVEKEYNILMVS